MRFIPKQVFFAAFLLLVFTLLYSYRLGFPPTEYYDEVYHVKTAREFIALSGNTDTAHPPLGKMLVALTIRIFGDHSRVWRIIPFVSGIGVLLMFFLLAKKFFGEAKPALFAAVLFALDGILITQSRITMLNTTMVLFMLLTLWFFIKMLEEGGGAKPRNFLLCGVCLGLAAATRWIGFSIVPVMGILFLKYFPALKEKRKFLLKSTLLLTGVPVLAYFAVNSFLLLIKGYHFKDLWIYQVNMFHYHSTLTATHGYGSEWWSWPVMTRPIWYFFERKDGIIRGILCIGNPAVFWAFIPALGYLIWDFLKTHSTRTAFILTGFLSQWLPWALISRVKFFHYYFTAMPFVALALTLYFQAIWNTGRAGKIFAACYFLLLLGMAAYWYPLWTAYPISEGYFQHHLWFKSWI